MIIRTISGEDINEALTAAMQATLLALVSEDLLDNEVATKFGNSHICISVTNDRIWQRIRKWLGLEKDKDVFRAVVFKISENQVI